MHSHSSHSPSIQAQLGATGSLISPNNSAANGAGDLGSAISIENAHALTPTHHTGGFGSPHTAHGYSPYYAGSASTMTLGVGPDDTARGFLASTGHHHFSQQPGHYAGAVGFEDNRAPGYKYHHPATHNHYGGYFSAAHPRAAPYALRPHTITSYEHAAEMSHAGFYPDYQGISSYTFDR